jgi:hypothetical protein
MEEMPILTRRRIEAEFARAIYAEMREELGEAAAKRLLASAVVKLAKQSAAAMAAEHGSNDLDAFRATRGAWSKGDALTIEVLESDSTHFSYNVTRCRYAEMYRELGIAELGAILSCNRDGAYGKGFNPNLELTRTQTMMQGAPCCDFRYRMKPEP